MVSSSFIQYFTGFTLGFEIRDLYTNDDTFITDADQWTATALRHGIPYTLCDGTYLLGGYDTLGDPDSDGGIQGFFFERVYNDLPDHNVIYYTISLWLLDSWDSIPADYFQLQFDSFLVEGWGVGIEYFEVNSCGRDWPDLANMTIFGQVSHSGSSLALRVISQLDSFGQDESLGFRDVHLIFADSVETNVNELCGLSSIPLPTNQCNCSYGEYLKRVSAELEFDCFLCDPSCRSCFGPTAQECYECHAGYSFVDGECIKCDESCAECSGPDANQCIDCVGGNSLFNGGICIANCLNTYIDDTVLVCDSPCLMIGQYYFYENQTCLGDCYPPFTSETLASGAQVCVSSCDTEGGFSYWDQTCNSICPSPLQGRNNGTSLCLYNCQPEEYLYWDGSCEMACESPFTSSVYKNRQFCQHPCGDPTDYIYWNGTCKSTCPAPLYTVSDGKASYCVLACGEGMFLSWDGFSCLESCDLPLRAREEDGVLFCDYPCSDNEYLYWDEVCRDSCPEPYHAYSLGPGRQSCSYLCEQYGDYFYPIEGECLPECNAPSIPRVQVVDDQAWYAVCINLKGTGSGEGKDDVGEPPENPLYFTLTTIKVASEKVAGIFIVLNIVLSLLRDSHVMILILVIKILNFVRYIDIRVPPQLVQDFSNYDQNHFYLNFGPDMSEAVKDDFIHTPLPFVFERAGLHSRFLVNFFKPITSFLIILGLMAAILVLQGLLQRRIYHQFVLIKMVLGRVELFLKWNLVVLLVVCNVDEITLYGIIEWRTARTDSDQGSMSLLISLGTTILSFSVIIAPFYLLDKIYQTRFKVLSNQANEPYFNLLKKIEGFRILWKDFQDCSGPQKSFLPLYVFRIALIYMIIGLLYKRPLLQMVLISSLSLGMLTFMSIVKPFMKKLDFIQSLIYEGFMLISIGSTLILAVLDRTQAKAEQLWLFLGDCIMYCNIWISLTAVIFFVYRFLLELQGVWEFYKMVPKPISLREFAIMFLREDDPVIQELKRNKRTSRKLDLTKLEREIERKNLARYNIDFTSMPDLVLKSNDEYLSRRGELKIRRALFGVKRQSSDPENSPLKMMSPSEDSSENVKLANKIKILNDLKKVLQDPLRRSQPEYEENFDSEMIRKSEMIVSGDRSPSKKRFLCKNLETINELDSMEASEIKNDLQTKRLAKILKEDLSSLSVVNKRLSSETMMRTIEEMEIIKEKDDVIKKKLTAKEVSQEEPLFES